MLNAAGIWVDHQIDNGNAEERAMVEVDILGSVREGNRLVRLLSVVAGSVLQH